MGDSTRSLNTPSQYHRTKAEQQEHSRFSSQKNVGILQRTKKGTATSCSSKGWQGQLHCILSVAANQGKWSKFVQFAAIFLDSCWSLPLTMGAVDLLFE